MVAAALAAPAAAAAEPLRVEAAIESRDIELDQPVLFQVIVTGSDQPEPADLAAVARDFTVQYLGPKSNSSTQISIVNGQVNKTVKTETVLTYRLTPRKTGTLTIPPFLIRAGNRQAMTPEVTVRVHDPGAGGTTASAAVTFRMDLSRETVCVGEPVLVTWTWTVGARLGAGVDFQLPLFEEPGFDFPDAQPVVGSPAQDRYQELRLANGRRLLALQTVRRTPAGDVIEVTFGQVLIPRRPGTFELPKSTVYCEVLVGTAPNRRRSWPFDDPFFEDMLGQRGTYRRLAVNSNAPTLTVQPLPEEGRPPGFAGHVGRYQMRVTAEPAEVSVGDPITLTIELSGPPYLDNVEGPDLESHEELNRGFRVSPPEPGIVEDGVKVFKRILRAKTPEVTRIPPLRLPYYDSAAREYRVAESAPIPLKVRPAKVVTAQDAEGNTPPPSEAGRRLQAWGRGIAANYEGPDVLVDQHAGIDVWLRSPRWGTALALPPALYAAALAATTAVRRRRADPAARRARQALAMARRELKTAAAADDAHARVLEALRQYFGARFRLNPGALVFRDIEGPLREHGIDEADRDAVRSLFSACEAGRYAGAAAAPGSRPAELAAAARRLLEKLDRRLGAP